MRLRAAEQQRRLKPLGLGARSLVVTSGRGRGRGRLGSRQNSRLRGLAETEVDNKRRIGESGPLNLGWGTGQNGFMLLVRNRPNQMVETRLRDNPF